MANVKNQQQQGKKKDRLRQRRRWVLMVASGNRHKVGEIAKILGGRFRVLGLDRLEKPPRIIENGRTFDSNASIKARTVRRAILNQCHPPRVDFVIADDSGLKVKALGGAPGLRSARYAGAHADDASNRRKLLREMQGKSNRSARFHCSIAVIPIGVERLRVFRGCIAGRITRVERGSGGFGYDPVFIPSGKSVTFAELNAAMKNRMSHRARSLRRMKRWLEKQTRPSG